MLYHERRWQNILKAKLWLQAVRPFAYPASIIPLLLGTILAAAEGSVNILLFLLVLIAGGLLHTGANLLNDYFDYVNGVDTPDSYGSSGVLVARLMQPRQILQGGLLALILVIPIGVYLVYLRGLPLLLLGIIGIAGAYFYTGKPIAYKYLGLGVPFVFMLMGPLMVSGAYYVQTGSFSVTVLMVSLPVGCLVSAILYANEYRDVQHDQKLGIRSPSIILGRRRARYLYYLLLLGAYFIIILIVWQGKLGIGALSTLLTLPLAIRLFHIFEITASGKETPHLRAIDVMTAKLYQLFGFLLILSLTLEMFLPVTG